MNDLEAQLGSHLTAIAMGLERAPATVDGRYHVEKLLGRGAFGLVLRAYDPHLARRLAIKCIVSADAIATFEALAGEAQTLAALRAPEIAMVYDCRVATLQVGAHTSRCVAVCMEHVDGVNLRRWGERRPPREDMLDVLLTAARGLEVAHAADIVHRDFKPENVVVTPSKLARLIDFGLAYRSKLPAAGVTSLQRASSALGTWPYLAPEARAGHFSTASDQYAFAVTAWEQLTGCRPFADDGSRGSDPRGHEHLPRPLALALRRALEPDPHRRFDTIATLRQELDGSRRSSWRGKSYLTAAAAIGSAAALGTAIAVAINNIREDKDK